MTTDPNGWPDEARPGVPMNPERDAFHWLMRSGGAWAEAWRWDPDADGCGTEYSGAWAEADGDGQPDGMARWYAYLGPCLLPAEVAALVAEAREDARADAFNNGMDEGATQAIKSLAGWLDVKEWEGGDGTETWIGDVSVEIGNVLAEADLYDKESGAVATHAMIAEARAKALDEAQQVARRVPIPCECSPAEAHGRMTGALAAAEAIRALKEKTT